MDSGLGESVADLQLAVVCLMIECGMKYSTWYSS